MYYIYSFNKKGGKTIKGLGLGDIKSAISQLKFIRLLFKNYYSWIGK